MCSLVSQASVDSTQLHLTRFRGPQYTHNRNAPSPASLRTSLSLSYLLSLRLSLGLSPIILFHFIAVTFPTDTSFIFIHWRNDNNNNNTTLQHHFYCLFVIFHLCLADQSLRCNLFIWTIHLFNCSWFLTIQIFWLTQLRNHHVHRTVRYGTVRWNCQRKGFFKKLQQM